MKMTQAKFWQLLAKAGRKNKWALSLNGNIQEGDIRCAKGACPILAVYALVFPEGTWVGNNGTYMNAAREMGLGEDFAESVMLAADGPVQEGDRNGKAFLLPLRKRLLKTLRIKVAA